MGHRGRLDSVQLGYEGKVITIDFLATQSEAEIAAALKKTFVETH